jgi:hypothetical protein
MILSGGWGCESYTSGVAAAKAYFFRSYASFASRRGKYGEPDQRLGEARRGNRAAAEIRRPQGSEGFVDRVADPASKRTGFS